MMTGEIIEQWIKEVVEESPYKDSFREPIVGFVDAADKGFDDIVKSTGVWHYKPSELLPQARTVVVFFLPYAEDIVRAMQKEKKIVPEYSAAYLRANETLSAVADTLQKRLMSAGIGVATQPPTDDYDHENLAAHWSHKSIAVMAGIGTWGLNHMLITKSGTAGRLNSIVIDEWIDPTPRQKESFCLYYKRGICKKCVERCPSGALTCEGLNKKMCSAYLDGKCLDLDEQGCPRCMSGPCAIRGFC